MRRGGGKPLKREDFDGLPLALWDWWQEGSQWEEHFPFYDGCESIKKYLLSHELPEPVIKQLIVRLGHGYSMLTLSKMLGRWVKFESNHLYAEIVFDIRMVLLSAPVIWNLTVVEELQFEFDIRSRRGDTWEKMLVERVLYPPSERRSHPHFLGLRARIARYTARQYARDRAPRERMLAERFRYVMTQEPEVEMIDL